MPDGEHRAGEKQKEASRDGSRDLQSVMEDQSSLGCETGLTLCFISPGVMTSCVSRTAGCATWPQRSSASCLLTQRRTSSPSPNTQTSLHSGRWPNPGSSEPQPGQRGTSLLKGTRRLSEDFWVKLWGEGSEWAVVERL